MGHAGGMSENDQDPGANADPQEGTDTGSVVDEGASTTLATRPAVSPEEKADRNWALAAHLSSLSSFVGIPGFVGPLIVWLVKKDDSPFAAAQAKEALNFQITLFLYAILCALLILTVIGALIGIPGLIVLGIVEIVFTVIAAIQAGEGKSYRYPMTIRLIT